MCISISKFNASFRVHIICPENTVICMCFTQDTCQNESLDDLEALNWVSDSTASVKLYVSFVYDRIA